MVVNSSAALLILMMVLSVCANCGRGYSEGERVAVITTFSKKGFIWKGYEEPIIVKSIDFSKFIESLDTNLKIICKLDIEGSEFVVLRHLISTGVVTKISELYVEFHEWTMINESAESRDKLIKEITDMGVIVHPCYE